MTKITPGLIILPFLLLVCTPVLAQSTAAPPALGQETKGEPALPEQTTDSDDPQEQAASGPLRALGKTRITESRRDSGQVYEIQLHHSMGSKQYIEEHDSDGKIESTNNDIEETPNLPKWKIGSW